MFYTNQYTQTHQHTHTRACIGVPILHQYSPWEPMRWEFAAQTFDGNFMSGGFLIPTMYSTYEYTVGLEVKCLSIKHACTATDV